MTDNFEHALEKENERLRAEVERLKSIIETGRAAHNDDRVRADTLGREVERLTRERDEARQEAEFKQAALNESDRSGGEWKARAEAAEADAAKWVNLESIAQDMLRKEMSRREDAEATMRHMKQRAEAAEADNAALAQSLRESCSGIRALDWVSAILSQPHPGAALLERLRAAQELFLAVQDTTSSAIGHVVYKVEQFERLSRAAAAYDAAKEGT